MLSMLRSVVKPGRTTFSAREAGKNDKIRKSCATGQAHLPNRPTCRRCIAMHIVGCPLGTGRFGASPNLPKRLLFWGRCWGRWTFTSLKRLAVLRASWGLAPGPSRLVFPFGNVPTAGCTNIFCCHKTHLLDPLCINTALKTLFKNGPQRTAFILPHKAAGHAILKQ